MLGVGSWRGAVVAALAVAGLVGVVPGALASTPAFTQVSGSPFRSGAGTAPAGVAFSPNGLLATANTSNFDKSFAGTVTLFSSRAGGTLDRDPPMLDDTVSEYSVAASGAVRPVNGSPFPTGTEPIVPAFSVDGTLLAIPDTGDDTVTVYRANDQDGNSQGQNNNN